MTGCYKCCRKDLTDSQTRYTRLRVWRYGLTMNMKRFPFFLFLSAVALGVWAQAGRSRETNSPRLSPELPRAELPRAELRAALKAASIGQETWENPLADNDTLASRKPYDLHLSAQERAELRKLLSQQDLDGLARMATKQD